MQKKIGFLLVIVVAVSMIMAGCASSASTPKTTSQTTSSVAPSTTSSITSATQAPTTTPQASSGGVIKIGEIRPLTGPLAIASKNMVEAFDFAFQQVNYQVAGKKIQIVVGDSQGDSATSIDVARKMVENDHVAMIVGPTMGGDEMAVAGYINQAGIPELFTNTAPDALMNPSNKWAISNDGTQTQTSSVMGVYAYEQLGYRKVDVLTGDDQASHGFLNGFMNAFKKKGGQIVQEQYTVYPCSDYAPYLAVLKPADAVVAWTDGSNAITLLTQYHNMGIDKRFPLVGAFFGSFLDPAIVNVLPPAVADSTVGDMVPTPWSPLLDNSISQKFVSDFQAKYGTVPSNADFSGPYQGALTIIHALQATNGDTTPDKLRQAILSVNFEGPEGPQKFDQQTMAPVRTIYICKIAKQGNAYVWQPVFSYKAVPPGGL